MQATSKQQYQKLEPQLPVFFRSWWMDAVCSGRWDVAVCTHNNEIVAVWPFQIETKFTVDIIRNPLLTPYLGPLRITHKAPDSSWLTELYQQVPKAGFMQFSCIPEFKEAGFFKDAGFNYTERVTYLLDLTKTEDQLWNNVHPKRRNAIRKAGAELTIVKDSWDMKLFMEWHKLSFEEKKKTYPYTATFFTGIMEAAKQHKSSVLYAVKDKEDRLIGQAWFVFDSRCMYCLLTATPAQTHRGAIALLIWTAILEAKKMGLTTFDFEGSMDPGIAHFFQRFGGQKEHYSEFSITRSRLWKLKQRIKG